MSMKTMTLSKANHLQINSLYPSKYLKIKIWKKAFFVSLKYLISVFLKMACLFFFSFQSDFLSHFSVKNPINIRKK